MSATGAARALDNSQKLDLNATGTFSAANSSVNGAAAAVNPYAAATTVNAAAARQSALAQQAAAEAEAEAGIAKKSKSLYFAIVVRNPFHSARAEPPHIPDDDFISGYRHQAKNPATFLRDDDFLKKGKRSANDFQRLIELLLRLERRRIQFFPKAMLKKTTQSQVGATEPYNFFRNYCLVESAMYRSPDLDEVYVLLHVDREILLDFAERQSLTLRTNPYSVGAGGGLIFTHDLEAQLTASARDYFDHFSIPDDDPDAFCRGKKDANGKWQAWGFCLEVPQRMRLLKRLLGEAWMFGGCGLQLQEMQEKQLLVLNSFFLHNEPYQQEYGLDVFCALSTCCSALTDYTEALVKYFGERIALYFLFVQTYCRWLLVPAIVGIPCGILQVIPKDAYDFKFKGVVGAVYSGVLILWAVVFLREWTRTEKKFAVRFGQEVESADEMVRDQFEYQERKRVHVETLFRANFDVPLTMSRLPTGEMVELLFPSSTRTARRWLVSYPLLLMLIGSLITALLFIEFFRFDNQDSNLIAIGASALSVVVSAIYGKVLHPFVVALLTEYENESSHMRLESEKLNKDFLFFAVNSFFSCAVIILFPNVPNEERLEQILVQMVTQLGVMPAVNNMLELILPLFMSSLQRRSDYLGSYFAGICSYFCCCGCCPSCDFQGREKPDENGSVTRIVEYQVWKEAQKAPYTDANNENVEIILLLGYALLFASVFPFSGVCIFVWTWVEIKVDASKLLRLHQRSCAEIAVSIGSSVNILWALIVMSIGANAYTLLFVHDVATEIGLLSAEMDAMFQSKQKHFYFSVLEHLFLAAIILYLLFRDGTPPRVLRSNIKIQLMRDKAVQGYITRALALPHDELQKHVAEPLPDLEDEKKKMAQPCTEVNRWFVFVSIAATIACGTAAIVLDQWLKSGESTDIGLLKTCSNKVCVPHNSSSMPACTDGIPISSMMTRLLIVFGFACGGVGFSFVPLLITFCAIRGPKVIALRCTFLALSCCSWAVAIALFAADYPWCDSAVRAGSSRSLSFFLAIASAASSFVACCITVGAIIQHYCFKDEKGAERKKKNVREPMLPPPLVSGAKSGAQQEMQQQKKQGQEEEQEEEEESRPTADFDPLYVNESNSSSNNNSQLLAQAAAAGDFSMFDADTDPALVGLDATFVFDPVSRMFYSHDHSLFYSLETRQYGTPAGEWLQPDGTWKNFDDDEDPVVPTAGNASAK